MPKVLDSWQVLPHGPLHEVDEGLLTVTGEIRMPLLSFPRRMTVARLAHGGSLIYNGIALAEPEMARLEALGRPSVLVVPSPFHRMDAKIWKARYPGLRVLTPAGAAARVEEVVPVDRGTLADPEVSLITVPGTGEREAALEVRRGQNLTVVVNDIIGNVPFPPDWVARLLIRMLGFGGGRPQVPRMVKLALIKDKPALKRQLLAWAAESGLRTVLPSHGEPLERDPRAALAALAHALG